MIYFKIDEFDFRGAPGYPAEKAEGKMDVEFLSMLDNARRLSGIPFVITSGYRPNDYDTKVHGIPNSDHSQGKGADILTHNAFEMFKVVKALIQVGFCRVGVAQNGHIHVGSISSTLPQNALWIE